ncbi:ATP-dependent nuclease [Flexibacterium corallicola]|uniref:ATP-dependent nuclease n=1 Tax=Flexibacterium corallicola TaxID=3037259 RepID=UPI00286F3EAE|nr:AAA family ATPase [Pseudovibrio sp. M1P-2-3]
MGERSKLLTLRIKNLGCFGSEEVEIALDNILCLVGQNNAGKSTVLRAYELAHTPSLFDPELDRSQFCAEEDSAVVELDVHVPEGTLGNIDEKWKIIKGEQRIVRSRWSWDRLGKPTRQTWNPEIDDWAADGKAGGADNVFKSGLPQPLRIGSLEDAEQTETTLMALALGPMGKRLKEVSEQPDSDLSKSISDLRNIVNAVIDPYQTELSQISKSIDENVSQIFPDLAIDLNIRLAAPTINVEKLLKEGSGLSIKQGKYSTSLSQQGAGARRALFWSMLKVHNELARERKAREDLEKTLRAEKKKKSPNDDKVKDLERQISAISEKERVDGDESKSSLPGYVLLIDEPENALHPMAARAAQKQLYELAKDSDWQVLITTHSPFFINPLVDHTTIIRLSRDICEDGEIKTNTYRADEIEFEGDEKQQLQAIQQMDVGFSEIFFGSYPIFVEGDTEHAAFLAAVVETSHPLSEKVSIVRARGKAILPALIKIATHFKIPFSVFHDTDWPLTNSGKKANPMWAMNQTIYNSIQVARDQELAVAHECSLPDFEQHWELPPVTKDKPLHTYLAIKENKQIKDKIIRFFDSIAKSETRYPLDYSPDESEYLDYLKSLLFDWAGRQGFLDDPKLAGAKEKV